MNSSSNTSSTDGAGVPSSGVRDNHEGGSGKSTTGQPVVVVSKRSKFMLHDDDDLHDEANANAIAVDTGKLGFWQAASFAINMCMGSGWLTAPFALAECGVILGSLLIIFFALAANQTKNYLIESIARIEAIEKVATGEVEGPQADVEKSGGGGGVAANEGGEDYLILPKPTYEIGTRRWEMTNCARKTMGLTGSVVFNIVYAFATFITLLAYAQIFATALASNIGDTSGFSSIASNCSNVDNMAVGGSCWSPYVISVWIFGVIVYSAAVAGMKETWWFQALFTMIRFIVLFMMVGTVLADTSLSKFPGLDDDLSAPRDDEFAFYMNFAGLGQAIPILAYMLLNLDVAPSVGAAMRKDRRQGLRGVFAVSGCVLTVLYILISVTVTWVFVMNGKSVPGTINLAWNSYGGDDATGGELLVKYLVVFFPPLDVLSGFPIQATALTNNIVSLFFGVRFQLTETFSWTRLAWYSGVVLVPLIIATFVSSVPDTLDISGPFQIGFAYVAPCLFIWIARNMCIRVFGEEAGDKTPFTNSYSNTIVYAISSAFYIALTLFLLVWVIFEYVPGLSDLVS